MKGLSYKSVVSVGALPTASTALAGVLVLLSTDNKPYWCDGTSWVDLTLTGSGGGGSATAAYTRSTFTPTAGQTTFSATYTVGFLEVLVNGALLAPADVTATNGTTFTISAVTTTDIVECIAYNVATINITDAGSLATGTVPTARLGSGTANNTTYLRGDQTWATLTQTSPGGTSGNLQYNDGIGGFAGATYVDISQGNLRLSDIPAIPTAPAANTLLLFAENHAGKMLPSAMGPSGVDFNLQASLYGNSTYMWLAGTGTTLAINWGTSFTAINNAGAQAHPTKASTSAITSMNRATFSTTATNNTASGIVSAASVAWLGNAAGLGGFFFFSRFGLESGTGTFRAMVGLSANTATLAAEPSTLVNTIAIGKDSADTNWFIITRSATTVTKYDTGIVVTAGNILDFYMHSAPNSQSVSFHIKNAITGATLFTLNNVTTNLPANTVFLNMQTLLQTTSASIKTFALNRMYCETDL
jgi:hypothetical protein